MQSHIWCQNCRTVQPMKLDKMFGNDEAGKGFVNPTDLMCGECRYVIATTWDASFVPPDAAHSQTSTKGESQ